MQRITVAVALAIVTASASAADPAIDPGLYEIVTKSNMSAPQTERKCLTTADIVKGLQPANLGPGCQSTRSVVAGGKFDFASSCPDMSMTMTGSYTASRYAIDGKVTMKDDGETTTIESHITARKVGACKAG